MLCWIRINCWTVQYYFLVAQHHKSAICAGHLVTIIHAPTRDAFKPNEFLWWYQPHTRCTHKSITIYGQHFYYQSDGSSWNGFPFWVKPSSLKQQHESADPRRDSHLKTPPLKPSNFLHQQYCNANVMGGNDPKWPLIHLLISRMKMPEKISAYLGCMSATHNENSAKRMVKRIIF